MLGVYLTIIDSEDDKSKFISLYEKYRKLMFYVAHSILKDEQLSEDAVQEAFLRIAKNFHKVGEVSCPHTRNFVVIITKNIAITMYNKNLYDFEEFTDNVISALSDEAFEKVPEKELTECILQLPEAYRSPLYLYYIYGYSIREISGLLSITVENAKKRIQRARHILKKMIEGGELL